MYNSFYNLKAKPFQISSDPSFIWLGENHKEALATLKYGVLDNKGFLLLTGDVGTGKTTLINTLISSLSEQVIFASVPDPRLEKIDFLNYIADSFGIDQDFSSKGKFIIAFSHFLRTAYEQDKSVLLVIDEAQLLTQELLEEIRLLSNINIENSTILNIFFVGQNEFNEVISRPENRAVLHRLTLNYNLEPLNLEQTREYIKHRLKVSGTTEEIFNPSATKEIYRYSEGLPRRINVICDHCLITGYVAEKKVIADKDVLNCIEELSIPPFSGFDPFQNREQPLKSELYEPSNVLFQSEPENETINEHFTDNSTQYPESAETEVSLDEPQNDKNGSLLKSLSIICLSVFALIVLYLIFPKLFIAIYDSTTNLLSPSNVESISSGPESIENTASTIITDSGKSLSDTVGNDSNLYISNAPENADKTTTQHEVIGPITITKADENHEVEEQPVPKVVNTETPASLKKTTESVIPLETVNTEKTILQVTNNEKPNQGSDDSEDNQIIATLPDSIDSTENNEKDRFSPQQETLISEQPDQPLIIRFDRNSVHFTSLDYNLVDEYVDHLISNPTSIVMVGGHTDSSGSRDYNYLISKYRAEIVKSYLVGRGVPESQTRVIGFGPRKPIADNDTEEGRELNRRVEVRLLIEQLATVLDYNKIESSE